MESRATINYQSASEVHATAKVLVQHYVIESIWETRD